MFKFSCSKFFFSSIKFSQSKIIYYSAKDYFDIVSDVSKYKDFLPWCSESHILTRHNENKFDAKLTINFKLYKASYISMVSITKKEDSYQIISDIEPNNQIFNILISKWNISPLTENHCQMKYDIEFEFRNFLYQQVSQYFIDIVGEKMTVAFENRLNDQNLRKNELNTMKKEDKISEPRKKNIVISNLDILESLKVKVKYFYEIQHLTDGEFKNIMEIIDKNLDLKEFLIQAYIIFCKNNLNYKDGEYKLLHYLKDICLMKRVKIIN